MKNKSIWESEYINKNVKKLNRDLDLDVLIIGGGLTGLSTLYNLRHSKLKIALVEENLVGLGTTAKTTGKINYLQELIYYDIAKKSNVQKSLLYLKSQVNATVELIKIIKKEKIACDLEQVTSFVYAHQKDLKKLQYQANLLKKVGIDVKEHYQDNAYSISVSNTFVFQPLKYILALKNICLNNKQHIYEKTKIIKIEKYANYYLAYTDKYKIKTKKIVLACHYPNFLIPYFMPLKVNIEKSYITASLNKYKKETTITSSLPTISKRYYQNKNSYLIYLNNSSKISDNLNEKNCYDNILNKHSKIKYWWKNTDLITIDKMPYIGRVYKNDDSLLIGTGYNTWGMTNASLAGSILSDILLNKSNEYEKLFDPLRINFFNHPLSILKNCYYNILSYVQNKIIKNKPWYQNIQIKNINGQSIATYTYKNKKYQVYNKCPHLGCSLVFNEVDQTWDCPCHASRFNLAGKCIKGPSTYDITYKPNSKFKYNNLIIKK